MSHTNARTVAAHAKVNLLLRILAREASGYHAIETLFQCLALHDVVTVRTLANERSLHCDGPTMPPHGLGAVTDNLAFRAAVAYTQAARWDTGWDITIDKHIPVGGGLGGGSADAAAVLRAMDALCPTPLGIASLLELGATLGADVPFCVSGYSRAWGTGHGDQLQELAPLPAATLEVYAFRDGVNTAAAYRAFADARSAGTLVPKVHADMHHGVSGAPLRATSTPAESLRALATWSQVAEAATNDFEGVVPGMHDGVRALLPHVKQRALTIRNAGVAAMGLMTGSGATCIVVYESSAVQLPPPLPLPPHCTLFRSSTL